MPDKYLDPLEVDLHAPMLSEFLISQALKMDLMDIGLEIRARWVAKVEKDTGNLASTAQVHARKGGRRFDRWTVEFTAGGPQAPYVGIVEGRDHALAKVLEEMGFDTGGFDASVPFAPRPAPRDRTGG